MNLSFLAFHESWIAIILVKWSLLQADFFKWITDNWNLWLRTQKCLFYIEIDVPQYWMVSNGLWILILGVDRNFRTILIFWTIYAKLDHCAYLGSSRILLKSNSIFKVQIFSEGHNFAKYLPLIWPLLHRTNLRWRYR